MRTNPLEAWFNKSTIFPSTLSSSSFTVFALLNSLNLSVIYAKTMVLMSLSSEFFVVTSAVWMPVPKYVLSLNVWENGLKDATDTSLKLGWSMECDLFLLSRDTSQLQRPKWALINESMYASALESFDKTIFCQFFVKYNVPWSMRAETALVPCPRWGVALCRVAKMQYDSTCWWPCNFRYILNHVINSTCISELTRYNFPSYKL